MKISYNWLKEYIKTDLSPEKISEILTSIGLEVDSMESWQSIKGGLEGFVVAKVLECGKHPNADKLSKTRIDAGQGRILDVVCGAPNVAAGQTVILATEGTKIYSDKGDFEIKKSKIRGETSEGMLCSEVELGLGNSHDGIMVLPNDVIPGTPAKEYFNVTSDYVFEIGLTPNRIDAASHYGVARDLAAYLKLNGTADLKKASVDSFKVENTSYPVNVVVENNEACPRYSGVTISGIEVKESPDWLKNKLKAVGLRPINNVVDITNFILYEIGQPLHAFDADLIKGRKITVKTLAEGTKFTTLDEAEHTLQSTDLMICDDAGGLALAGIFGGLNSGITEKTKNIFIESAYFNPGWVRKTSRRLGVFTDSSFRFERGTDPNIPLYALKRAAIMVKELAGGTISSEIVDVYPNPVKDFNVHITYNNIKRLIGIEIPQDTIKKIIESLEIKIVAEKDDALNLLVPPYRVDVMREADVIEEIMRIYGFNNVNLPQQVNAVLTYEQKPDKDKVVNIISDYLSSNGFNEIMNNSLTRSAYYESSDAYKDHIVYIKNPLSSDLNCMRQSLLYGGLEVILKNTNFRNPNLKLYEFGNTYFIDRNKKITNPHEKYQEVYCLSLLVSGLKQEGNWLTPETPSSFYYLKTYVQNILSRLGIAFSSMVIKHSTKEELSDGLCYEINGDKIVNFGLVKKTYLKQFDLKNDVYYAEFNWDMIMKLTAKSKVVYKELPKYPEVKRDLSLLLDESVTFDQLKTISERTERKILREVSLFDVYISDKLEKGKKSYALRFTLFDENKTLTDQEIDKIMSKLQTAFEKELGAKLR